MYELETYAPRDLVCSQNIYELYRGYFRFAALHNIALHTNTIDGVRICQTNQRARFVLVDLCCSLYDTNIF